MKPIVRDFFVGATAISGVIVLVLGMIFFGTLNLEKTYTFKVRLTSAGGLARASRVTMNGVAIGQIDSAKILPPDIGGVELTLLVKSEIVVPRKAAVGIEKGLIGDASLDFVVPPGLTPAEIKDVITPGATFEGGSPGSLFDKLVGALEKPMERLTVTAEKIDKLADIYTAVGERINEAIEPRTIADVKSGKAPNIRSLVERIDITLADADQVLGDKNIQQQIKDIVAKADLIMSDAQSVVATIKQTAGKLDSTIDTADKTIKEVGAATTNATTKVNAVADQAVSALRKTEDAAANLATVLETAARGEGTIGQLMQNPDLYNNLRDAAARLEKALTEFQLMVEKFKAEGIRLKL